MEKQVTHTHGRAPDLQLWVVSSGVDGRVSIVGLLPLAWGGANGEEVGSKTWSKCAVVA